MAGQITKDLGGITAYAAAVAAGYTGTKAQFETLMASYATVAQNAAASATAAATSKSDAEAFAKGTRNGTPVSSGDAAYENNSKYFAEQAGDYAESLDPDTIARIDGYYDTLGAGTAEQLTSNIYEEDNIPYNFRTSGGSIDIGDRETDMLVGGTVAWNQLCKDGDFTGVAADRGWQTNGNYGTLTYSENVGTYAVATTGSAGHNNAINNSYDGHYPIVFGHKYLLHAEINPAHDKPSNNTGMKFWLNRATNNDGENVGSASFTLQANKWNTVETIMQSGTSRGFLQVAFDCRAAIGYEVGDVDLIRNVMCIDLTAMFGSTIADYIYSLEQATAGAGVAWFKKLFPKPYYAYNAGELMSVQASSHDMVGFNQFDVANADLQTGIITDEGVVNGYWEGYEYSNAYTKVLPNTVYSISSSTYASGKYYYVACYDSGKNFIEREGFVSNIASGSTFSTPSNCEYIRIVRPKGAQTDYCINLHWDGERDGEYEAYVKHSYALDSDLVLRGIPKLDNGNLYYDGDTYESDGTVTRKYGIVDLGTLNWSRNAANQFYAPLPTAGTQYTGNQICTKYQASARGAYDANGDKCATVTGSNCWVRDSAYDVTADFKASLNGVYLVYELETPTTETADPYTNPQIVNDFGTEEYVDYPYSQGTRDVAIPVGHQTQYMANLKAKLEMSPSSPEGAGDYIVRQTNGENEYVTLASNATIQNIIARLEALEGGGE